MVLRLEKAKPGVASYQRRQLKLFLLVATLAVVCIHTLLQPQLGVGGVEDQAVSPRLFETIQTHHMPRLFSDNTQRNVDRGLNIINMWSGPRMAAFIYEGQKPVGKKFQRWWAHRGNIGNKWRIWKDASAKKLIYNDQDADNKMQPGDTLYVSYAKLEEFVDDFLPKNTIPFVVISTRWALMHPPQEDLEPIARNITSNQYVLHWFAQDIGTYTGGQQHNAKVSSIPNGLKPALGVNSKRNPIPLYREAFLYHLQKPNKTIDIFVSHLGKTTTSRQDIPSGRDIPYHDYLSQLGKSHYVLSPDGNHPDCHRHYEAIGLGAIPITQLDPTLYSHLQEGLVVFNNSDWNVTSLKSKLPIPSPPVNRNMVFEEYWMEYMERIVGKPLRWWDILQDKQALLADLEKQTLQL